MKIHVRQPPVIPMPIAFLYRTRSAASVSQDLKAVDNSAAVSGKQESMKRIIFKIVIFPASLCNESMSQFRVSFESVIKLISVISLRQLSVSHLREFQGCC